MRWIAIIGGIVILLIAILVAVPLFIPTEVYRDKLVGLVKTQTGRDLVIGGDVGLSFFPRLAVSVGDARFQNASWGKEADMASMKEMRAALKIMPLFKGEVEIDSFVLVDPVIHLEVRKDGTPNWKFTPPPQEPGSDAADEESSPTDQDEGSAARINQIRLGEVSIKNGSATYANAQTGKTLALADVNLDLSLPSLDDPFKLAGSAVWNGEKVDLSLAAERPRAFSEGGDTPVDLSISSKPLQASYKGVVQPLQDLRFEGATELAVPSLRDLASWLGSPLAPGAGFGELKVEGRASGKGTTYVFSDAKVALDGMKATGDLAIQTGGARPLVSGKLAFDRIDANTYMGASIASSSGAASGTSDTSASDSAAPAASVAPAPVAPVPVASSSAVEGWSREPIDLGGLRAADVRFSLSANELLVKKIKIGASALTLKIENGLLTANLTRLSLYEGAGSGVLTLNGAGRIPALTASFNLTNLSAEPFLIDAMDFRRLEGRGNINFDVTAQGQSQRDMIGALNGNGAVRFTNGAIKGINIAQLFRNVFSNPVTGWESGGSQNTDFSELGGTFTIARGILSNNDLKMQSPLLRVAGEGTVDLPNRMLKYRIDPKLVASLEGQGGNESKGINIPVLVEGPWTEPRFRPDLESMLQNREQVIETIKSLKGGGGKQILNNLLGRGGNDDAQNDQEESGGEEKKATPADALKSLFGR